MPLKIGIYGGTFDPIHFAHITIAKTAVTFLQLDELLFMPSYISPNKTDQQITSAEHRYNMVKLAIGTYPQFSVSPIEIERQGTSYTVDTLLNIHDSYRVSSESLFLIVGGDSLVDFESWKGPEKISQLCQIVVAARADYDFLDLSKKFPLKVTKLPTPLLDISSTKIRENIRKGKSIDTLVPELIISYIKKHSLYGYSPS